MGGTGGPSCDSIIPACPLLTRSNYCGPEQMDQDLDLNKWVTSVRHTLVLRVSVSVIERSQVQALKRSPRPHGMLKGILCLYNLNFWSHSWVMKRVYSAGCLYV